MSEFNITVEGGTSYRLHTAGKFCDRDIVVTAEGGGDTNREDYLLSEEYTAYSNDRVTKLRSYLFAGMTGLEEVHFPEVTQIGENTFGECYHLSVADMPKLSFVGSSAFFRALKAGNDYNFPAVEKLEDYAFDTAKAKKVSLPVATTLGEMCFVESGMEEIIAPNATALPSQTCRDCSNLVAVNFDAAESIGYCAFANCVNLQQVDFPSVKNVEMLAFSRCTRLVTVSLGKIESIAAEAFVDCSQLQTVIMRNAENVCVCDLSAFNGTPIMTGQGHIYVPTAMYEYYRAGYEAELDKLMPGFFDILFRMIEDYPEICGTT